ncbi:hypothetical protein TUBRATIS_005390 [Tubulinosema ratisbonensis]|uniref:Uncharacterized protein n=1 Tax=Tubulinosema ratisbonensis TaxID=291195 RepID=A0A437AP16_9MICR|nr:hypothetical protein TUBRATIS_005390 [Tubulinosema ratisbonensis]
MYFTKINEEEKENYISIKVDNKMFYKLKLKNNLKEKKKKRYSDQFKDKSFDKKDILRKLKIIKSFKENNSDLEFLIEKWTKCIGECIFCLSREYFLPANQIFKAFSLKKHGFNYDDFCNNSEIEEENCFSENE